MSWNEPTQEEAAKCYEENVSAAAEWEQKLFEARQQAADYENMCSQGRIQMADYDHQKLNFERRLDQINELIQNMNGNGALQNAIEKLNRSVGEAQESYQGCIRYAEVPASALSTAFSAKSVTEDDNCNKAVQILTQEANRLRDELKKLREAIDALESKMREWTAQLGDLILEQQTARRNCDAFEYEAAHYKQFI